MIKKLYIFVLFFGCIRFCAWSTNIVYAVLFGFTKRILLCYSYGADCVYVLKSSITSAFICKTRKFIKRIKLQLHHHSIISLFLWRVSRSSIVLLCDVAHFCNEFVVNTSQVRFVLLEKFKSFLCNFLAYTSAVFQELEKNRMKSHIELNNRAFWF